ncbi:MAG: hypothetical protein HY064_12380 [Bacteroidetes bacterium]|nr:hypothetical protein [Bacteroidota bacterium]
MQKLIALGVLVFFLLFCVGMIITPTDKSYYCVYPIGMVVIIPISIIGILIDRAGERKLKAKELGSVRLTEDNRLTIAKMDISKKERLVQNFKEERNSFILYRPAERGWKKQQYMSYAEYMIKFGMATKENIAQLESQNKSQHQYSRMYWESQFIIFQFGDDVVLEFTDESTMKEVEYLLDKEKKNYLKEEKREMTPDEIRQARVLLVRGESLELKLSFTIGAIVAVFDKKLIEYVNDESKILPNFMKFVMSITIEPIDELRSFHNENSIIMITRATFIKVNVNGLLQDFNIYRAYKFIETDERIYMLQIQWSPESHYAIEVWEELRKVLDSFEIIDH